MDRADARRLLDRMLSYGEKMNRNDIVQMDSKSDTRVRYEQYHKQVTKLGQNGGDFQ